MVAKPTPDDGLTDYERGLRALQALPESDEDPAAFWGPDWEKLVEEAEADEREGRTTRLHSTEEFLAHLSAIESESADV